MPNPRSEPDFDEWVQANAAEVARNVARHDVPITWSEAAERLRRTVRMLSGPVLGVDDGGALTPMAPQEPDPWKQAGFAESVACAAVHHAGQPYYPESPENSPVELAVPWDTATALVHLLSALMVARLTDPDSNARPEQAEVAQLLHRLSADVAFEFSRDDDDLLADAEKVGERVYLLMQCRDVWQAVDLLGREREALRLAGLTDIEAFDLTLWEAHRWLFGPFAVA